MAIEGELYGTVERRLLYSNQVGRVLQVALSAITAFCKRTCGHLRPVGELVYEPKKDRLVIHKTNLNAKRESDRRQQTWPWS